MNKWFTASLAGLLASAAFTATAGNTASTATFSDAQGSIVVAQAEALDDYHKYLDRMMDDSTMQMLDMNGDGEITRKEFMTFHKKVFQAADKNKDGKLMKDEMTRKSSSSG